IVVEKRKQGGCGRVRLSRGDTQVGFAKFVGRNCEPLTMVKTRQMPDFCEAELRKAKLVPYAWPKPHAPAIACVYSLFRRQLLGTSDGAISSRYALRCLDEGVFRFNRRTSRNRWLLVGRLLETCAQNVPTLRQLRKGT